MRTFKKIGIVSLILVALVSAVSALLIEPMIRNEGVYCCDAQLRKTLSGTIDFIYIGDSDGMTGFCPELFDQSTDSRSYNLSGTMMTMHSRYYLLEKEIRRNPISTVVLQISPEALLRKNTNYGDGDSATLMRLDSLAERIGFMLRYVAVNDWLNIYSRHLVEGVSYWKDVLTGSIDGSQVDYSARGWKKVAAVDVSLSSEEAASKYNTSNFEADFFEDSVDELRDVIALCKENNIRVILVSQPFSDAWIWETDAWDNYGNWLKDFSRENDCEFLDFNLLKDRYVLFSDERSFKDTVHMSEDGATAFTMAFAETLNRISAGDEIDTLFYDSYVEMKLDSPYAASLHVGAEE